MNITLDKLTMRNFKGISDLAIDFYGGDACVYGANATGKTTIYDAFLWLLFDKDSTNRKDFAVKPHDKAGNEIHYLETSVEARLLVDGTPLTLKKTYEEKWTKKRGEAEQTMGGHVSAYWIDEVPKSKGEYTAAIGSMVNEDTFRLITNPAYFNTVLSWQERRTKLFEMAGSMTDEEIIASTPEFANMDLGGHTVDDARKVAKQTIRKLNDEIEKIPVRIDEQHRVIPKVGVDYDSLESRVKQLKKDMVAVDDQLNDARKAGEAHMSKVRELGSLKAKLDERKRAIGAAAGETQREAQDKLRELQHQANTLEIKADGIKRTRARNEQEIADVEERMNALRGQWGELYREHFDVPDSDAELCPTCGQAFPEDYLAEKLQSAQAAFETKKQKELAAINAKGLVLKGQREVLAQAVNADADRLDKLATEIARLYAEIETVKPLAEADIPKPDYAADNEFVRLEVEIGALDDELEAPDNSAADELSKKRGGLQIRLDELNGMLARRDIIEDAKKRIEDLKAEEKRLNAELSKQEKLLNQLEEFAKYKCSLLEQRINELFPTVRWKLFDIQVNGGISDCCECLVGGVPFSDANNAARINAGLEIADVLAAHAGVTAPVFVDNAEAVNDIRPISGQMVALLVSDDETLKIETANKKEAA